jgi:hypothetical protein
MFVPLEVVDEMCTYLPNSDLVSMARVCRDWHPTCTRHLSTELRINTHESFHPRLQRYLDNFNGTSHHTDVPTRPSHVTLVRIEISWTGSSTEDMVLDFDELYPLLDHLGHVRHLDMDVEIHPSNLDLLETACKEIHARLPNIKYLVLCSEWWIFKGEDDEPTEELYQAIYKCMMGDYRLTNMDLYHYNLLDGTAMLTDQASTLVKLHAPFCFLVDPMRGFRVASFPRVKELGLESITMPTGLPSRDGHMLDFWQTFPSLESLSMETWDLCKYGGEDLWNILHMASTHPYLKHLKLDVTEKLEALPSTWSITFNHLETLVLRRTELYEKHVEVLASLQWPSLTSLSYLSKQIYPNVVPRLLAQAPRLKAFKMVVYADPKFSSNLGEMFGWVEWPKLQSVCIGNLCKEDSLPDHMPEMETACPNATIHLALKGDAQGSRLFYGVHLPPQCSRKCAKCGDK